MKGQLKQKLEVGDRIMLYHMEGEGSVTPGTLGTVTRITRDPFEKNSDEEIVMVKWDNGSTLSLITATDVWKKLSESPVSEQNIRSGDPRLDFAVENEELFRLFDWKFLREYLGKVRDSGIINMYGAAPLLYSGKQWIDRYYGENPPDQESFDEVLEIADKAKDKMIQGTLKYMKSKNMEIELPRVNNIIGRLATKMVGLYATFY
jgi:hypothetical protein